MKFLNREDGSYGPIPSRRPLGMLGMPMNTTSIGGLYCVGDSTFPGQVRSRSHVLASRVFAILVTALPIICFLMQGVNAVVFSGFGCAHRVLCDLGMQPTIPVFDGVFKSFLNSIRDNA